jgi:hypothetical protein
MVDQQAEIIHLTIPPDSEEYFDAMHDNAYDLMQKKEFEKALLVLENVHDYIRKTDQTSQLGYNLILQAEIHLVKKYSLSYLELFLNLRFHIRK